MAGSLIVKRFPLGKSLPAKRDTNEEDLPERDADLGLSLNSIPPLIAKDASANLAPLHQTK
ncbi:hypothetical protein C7B64_05690 [Merismopedia glauca CCAP 1448/3]|uniref:Uncharacterized protein n=1 Tax=Merismopedia glauca CCAP 1448/3 TaxID=1296344 RepID=A0A2T1C6Y4_9CYAN|nr:hypothetical protein C7B64_05690 [Merismopedia glauca CCAP 1448/3]